MSFISIVRKAGYLGVAMAGALTAFSGEALAEGDFNNPSDKKLMCQYYANEADFQARENNRMNCGGVGNRWGEGKQGHYNWCMSQRDTRVMNTEIAIRTQTISHCNKCNDYALARNKFETQWNKLGCYQKDDFRQMDRYRGPGLTSRKLLVFACMNPRKSTTQMNRERTADNVAMAKCDNFVNGPPVMQSKKGSLLKWSIETGETPKSAPKPIKSTGKPKSVAPDHKSLQISSAISDIGDFYEPIAKSIESAPVLKTYAPAPKPRTEKIVVGNRYVEVPAYSDDLTAAVTTGAVAAKVLDYADDYKGGINKSMSGAAEALKEKLKDRLDGGGFYEVATSVKDKIKDGFSGGGINKSMSGAAEALKEKLKDRLASGGGINKAMSGAAGALKEKLKDRVASGGGIKKAMSGAKEALKYKLKERAAGGGLMKKAASGFKEKFKSKLTGGGGGLMKGMAKASGGALRGLLRR